MSSAGDGFVLVGDAAAFMDPFYSPGMDWISFTTTSATELITAQRRGESMAERIEPYNRDFSLCYQSWFESVYKDKYEYMGEWDLMSIAFRRQGNTSRFSCEKSTSNVGSFFGSQLPRSTPGRYRSRNDRLIPAYWRQAPVDFGALKYCLIRANREDIITAVKPLPGRLFSSLDCLYNEAAEGCKRNLPDKYHGLYLGGIRPLTTLYKAI